MLGFYTFAGPQVNEIYPGPVLCQNLSLLLILEGQINPGLFDMKIQPRELFNTLELKCPGLKPGVEKS